MYIEGIRDLYSKTQHHIHPFGRCLFLSSEDGYVEFLLYETLVFRAAMPEEPYNTFSFVHVLADNVLLQAFFGKYLTFVENTETDFTSAIETLNDYARLLLPDKFLAAYEAARKK